MKGLRGQDHFRHALVTQRSHFPSLSRQESNPLISHM